MLIENPDTFKSWLTSILEPLCDADPAALAKYVYALVKKDKPLDELREGMLDQLDVFLQHETKPFVDMLFKSLESQEYLMAQVDCQPTSLADEPEPVIAEREPEQPAEQPDVLVSTAPLSNGVESREPPVTAVPPRQRVVLNRLEKPRPRLTEQTLVKVLPLNELLEEPVDQLPRRRDRRGDAARRRRRSRSWERRARLAGPRRHSPDRRTDKRRLLSRSPSPRRYRNRSPPPPGERPPSRSRSRSPMPVRQHERERDRPRMQREMERERMSRDRDHRERISRSRERDRSRDRSRERSAGTPTQDNDRLLPAYRRRCRDFDEKGYCMRGDLCQWDHGPDPVVLEDSALSRVLAAPPVPEYNPQAPDIWGGGAPFPPPAPAPPTPRALVPIPRIRPGPPPMHQIPPMAMPLRPPPPKKNYDFSNRLGPRPPLNHNMSNCSLEVKKVPRGLNDITHLNNHFSKFGKIVNIQVCFENDPEGALITFSNHTEANVAYKSTEAVLNNRFIKVFWYNPENKDKNSQNASANNAQPGGRAAPPPPASTAATAAAAAAAPPLSQHKVLINKENIMATAHIKQAKADQLAKQQESNGAPPARPADKARLVMEMHRRAQSLLHTQLQQQTLLIRKLETGNATGPQKAALMEAIKSAQEGIEKLQKELVAYNKTIMQVQEESVARLQRLQLAQANAKRPKTREEAQKEILDAELDMFTKQQEGQDVTELMKKIAELRHQMSIQFPTHHPAVRRLHSRGGRFNTATRYNRNNLPSAKFNNQSVDHRPRAVLISGFEPDELDNLIQHFSQFGEVTGKEVNLAVPELTLQFRARSMAELAAAKGRNYNERTLSITWVTNNKPITPIGGATPSPSPSLAAAAAAPSRENGTAADTNNGDAVEQPAQEVSEETLLRFDEEEDDDAEEDRTWRR